MTRLLYGPWYEKHREYSDLVKKDPVLQSSIEFHEMSREEIMER